MPGDQGLILGFARHQFGVGAACLLEMTLSAIQIREGFGHQGFTSGDLTRTDFLHHQLGGEGQSFTWLLRNLVWPMDFKEFSDGWVVGLEIHYRSEGSLQSGSVADVECQPGPNQEQGNKGWVASESVLEHPPGVRDIPALAQRIGQRGGAGRRWRLAPARHQLVDHGSEGHPAHRFR